MEEGAAHWLFMRTPHAYTSGDSLLRCCKAHGGISRSDDRSEEHTSELQSLMRISYDVFCLKKKNRTYKVLLHMNYNITTPDKQSIHVHMINKYYYKQ